MLWLSRPPWARWVGAGLIVIVAMWIELAPKTSVGHPFAIVDISPGEMIDSSSTEMRSIPVGLLDPVEIGVRAAGTISAGEPILVSDVEVTETPVPKGWWVVSAALPRGGRIGDHVQVVMLGSGNAVPGIVVAEGSTDPFDTSSGAIAVGPEHAAEVATATAEGRVTVLISTG